MRKFQSLLILTSSITGAHAFGSEWPEVLTLASEEAIVVSLAKQDDARFTFSYSKDGVENLHPLYRNLSCEIGNGEIDCERYNIIGPSMNSVKIAANEDGSYTATYASSMNYDSSLNFKTVLKGLTVVETENEEQQVGYPIAPE